MAVNRRTILSTIARIPLSFAAAAAAPVISCYGADKKVGKSSCDRSTVILTRRTGVIDNQGAIDADMLFTMIGDGVTALTGKNNITQAWRSLFSKNERIGIKVNTLGGRNRCTHPQLAAAVAGHLAAAGIAPHNILIFDRLTDEMNRAGYTIVRGGSRVQCYGTDHAYEAEPEMSGTIGSCFSTLLTRRCDAVISLPVLKDHDLSGVSMCLKNFYGVIHNPNKYHDNGCDPFIADLNLHSHIRSKRRLTIIDGLSAQYSGGPSFKPQWSWNYRGLLFSTDPVAADSTGARIIDKKRKEKNMRSLREAGRPWKHIHTAARRGLGITDTHKIELITA